MAILERTTELDDLSTWLQEARAGNGRLVLVSGELGIGKTTLVEEFVRLLPSRVAVTSIPFDGLSIPAPLGPLLDVAQSLGHDVDTLLASQAPRSRVFRAIETTLRHNRDLPLIVAEDAHWADDASLEFIRFVGRRIGSLRAMIIVTFRNDELSPGHPLRQVIGDLATGRALRRITLPALSAEAVRSLAEGSAIDPAELHAHTGGNPFFVTEILAAGGDTPISIREAVLGRAARLGIDARETLDIAAAIGLRVDPLSLTGAVGRPIEPEIAAAFDAGLLRGDGVAIAFRHSAVRAVILDEISPARSQALHQRILTYLQRQPGDEGTATRLAFHAEQARNRQAAYCYAIEAAAQAIRLQSHREAADQYARALRCADGITPGARAEILEAHAYACFLTSRMSDAIASQQTAAEIWQDLGEQIRYGHNLRRLSRYWLFDGRYRHAATLAEQSFETLQGFPASTEFAMACGYLAEWRIRADRLEEARQLADQALAIARCLNEPATTAHALITSGMVDLALDKDDGYQTLDAGRTLARKLGHEEFELRALTHLAEAYGTHRYRPRSRSYAEIGLTLARTRDFSTMIALFGSARLMLQLDACDWSAAIAEADTLIRNGGTAGRLLLIAQCVWTKARLRSGQGIPSDLEPALRHAAKLDDPVARSMVISVQLESSWLSGRLLVESGPLPALLDEVHAIGDLGTASELALWMWRTGSLPDVPSWLVEPHAAEIRGDPDASALWESARVPLEALRSQSASHSESDLRAAHAGLTTLSALPDAHRVASKLRRLGYRGVPRGPRPSTRQNPALLSRREIEVLTLLAQGSTNREIARQLSVSPKTVDHHVSAILGKLAVANRQQAVVRGRETGALPI